MTKPKPPSVEVFPWLRANLGKRALGVLTGTDTRALQAAVQIMEHYAYDRDDTVLQAYGLIVQRMQPGARSLAYHAIAMTLEWSDRKPVWLSAGLDDFEPAYICAFEPRGSYIDGQPTLLANEPKPKPQHEIK